LSFLCCISFIVNDYFCGLGFSFVVVRRFGVSYSASHARTQWCRFFVFFCPLFPSVPPVRSHRASSTRNFILSNGLPALLSPPFFSLRAPRLFSWRYDFPPNLSGLYTVCEIEVRSPASPVKLPVRMTSRRLTKLLFAVFLISTIGSNPNQWKSGFSRPPLPAGHVCTRVNQRSSGRLLFRFPRSTLSFSQVRFRLSFLRRRAGPAVPPFF